MLNITICDDMKEFRDDLAEIISIELDLKGVIYHISEYSSGEELLSRADVKNMQILFLDIEMKSVSGIEAAKRIRRENTEVFIIFVTSHSDFVFQGYDVQAFNYILKPYEKKKIKEVLAALPAVAGEAGTAQYLVEYKGKSTKLKLDEILYFESNKRLINVITYTGRYEFYGKLNEVEKEMTDIFIRIHNRYLVNLKHIQSIESGTACIKGQELPVSRAYKQSLTIAYTKYALS